MKRKVIYILLALVIALPASAQKLYNDAISLSGVSLWQQGNSLYIDMTIDMKNLAVSPPTLTDSYTAIDRRTTQCPSARHHH